METREEKLALWAEPSDTRLQSLRVLKGSISLHPNDFGEGVRISEEEIQCDRIEKYLLDTNDDETSDDKNPPNLWHFKAISFPRIRSDFLALSFPKQVFQQIQASWNLHPRTIEVFLSNNGVFTTFHSSCNKRTFLLLKVANSRSTGFDCVSMTCDPLRRTIHVLYHHLEDEASVFATLLSSPEQCIDPYFFVAALYRSHYQHLEIHRHRIDDAIKGIERQTGFGTPGMLMGIGPKRHASVADPTSTIQELGNCQTDLAIIGHAARCCLDCGERLVQAIDESLVGESPRHEEQERRDRFEQHQRNQRFSESLREMRSIIRQDVEYIRRRTVMLLSQVQAVKERAQSQTNFMLNTITQKDAEYTAAIAVDGKRDSIAMKTIAILGIVFLPGTYIATLFGMNMFTKGGGDGEEISSLKVSPSLWIYWAITVPLTVATFIVWLLWARRETLETSKRLMIHRKKEPVHDEGTAATKTCDPISGEKMV